MTDRNQLKHFIFIFLLSLIFLSCARETATPITNEVIEENLTHDEFVNGTTPNFNVIDGVWEVVDGKYQITAASTDSTTHLNNRVVHTMTVSGDFSVEVEAQAVSSANGWSDFALLFNYQDPNNYYFFSSNQSNDGSTSGIFKVVSGVSTELADISSLITTSTTYQLRLERIGDQIKAYRDNTLLATASDSTFASGQVGLGAKSNQAVFDNFAVNSIELTTPPPPPPPPPPVPTATLLSPPQASINAAIAHRLLRYDRTMPGGAHINEAWTSGGTITMAVASYAGNTSADARLLEQMRYTIIGDNAITANGGYPAQHEKHVTGMYTIAKFTPRIWNQLTAQEKTKIDLLMKAALVASAFTTSDNNPFVKAGTQQYALDGDSNLNRGWNPNYREGMLGGVLVGLAYFGGAAPTIGLLDTYNHSQFVSELSANGLTNIYETFTWKEHNPSSGAPTGAMIEAGIRSYRYYGVSLNSPMELYWKLASDTYGAAVSCGLNNGAGVSGCGRILSGCDTLPNKGRSGMLKEFASVDAGGPRSSIAYSYDGFRPHQTNQIALIVGGLWDRDSTQAYNALQLLQVGIEDIFYKFEKGYSDYSKGACRGTYYLATANRGIEFTRPMWEQVLKPFHGLK